MAIIVEDGTGKADGEAYITVADAATYHAARGNAAWAALASDAVREQMLRRATEYMLQVYRSAWKGVRMTATQALDWPRGYVYLEPVITGANQEFPNLVADDIVPVEVKRACAELALRAATGPLAPDLGQAKSKVKVGPIETEYDRYSPQTKRYQSIDMMLAPLLARGASVSARLVRT